MAIDATSAMPRQTDLRERRQKTARHKRHVASVAVHDRLQLAFSKLAQREALDFGSGHASLDHNLRDNDNPTTE